MTDAQEKRLQALLGQRRRRHRIGVRGSTEVWIESTDGAPD